MGGAGCGPGTSAAVFAWLADWYRSGGERDCVLLKPQPSPDPADPAHPAIVAEKPWLSDLLARLAPDADLGRPDQLAAQLLLLIDRVAAASGARPGSNAASPDRRRSRRPTAGLRQPSGPGVTTNVGRHRWDRSVQRSLRLLAR